MVYENIIETKLHKIVYIVCIITIIMMTIVVTMILINPILTLWDDYMCSTTNLQDYESKYTQESTCEKRRDTSTFSNDEHIVSDERKELSQDDFDIKTSGTLYDDSSGLKDHCYINLSNPEKNETSKNNDNITSIDFKNSNDEKFLIPKNYESTDTHNFHDIGLSNGIEALDLKNTVNKSENQSVFQKNEFKHPKKNKTEAIKHNEIESDSGVSKKYIPNDHLEDLSLDRNDILQFLFLSNYIQSDDENKSNLKDEAEIRKSNTNENINNEENDKTHRITTKNNNFAAITEITSTEDISDKKKKNESSDNGEVILNTNEDSTTGLLIMNEKSIENYPLPSEELDYGKHLLITTNENLNDPSTKSKYHEIVQKLSEDEASIEIIPICTEEHKKYDSEVTQLNNDIKHPDMNKKQEITVSDDLFEQIIPEFLFKQGNQHDESENKNDFVIFENCNDLNNDQSKDNILNDENGTVKERDFEVIESERHEVCEINKSETKEENDEKSIISVVDTYDVVNCESI